MEFKTPLFFILIPLVLPLLVWAYFRHRPAAFLFSSSPLFSGLKPTWKMRLQHVPFFLRLLVVVLFIVALAGPRKPLQESKSSV
ncbi:MAG: BatA domain-containing protein, partial [Candidatus Omnitrophica bacterium]|nr:BatA domain-containing protein [Candidatus Omnitrophota bacterium]